MELLRCFICRKLVCHGLPGLRWHFTREHGLKVSEEIDGGYVCGQGDCIYEYTCFRSLSRHIQERHLNKPDCNQLRISKNTIHHMHEVQVDVMEIEENNTNDEISVEKNDEDCGENEIDLKKFVVRMIARFQAHGGMTGAMMKNVLEELEDFMNQLLAKLKDKIDKCLKFEHVDVNVTDSL